jgi:Flp pilus assembly pilin Flp
MMDWVSLKLGQAFLALKREEGQGATEYAMVIAFLIVGLGVTLGVLGAGIEGFLQKVADKLTGIVLP